MPGLFLGHGRSRSALMPPLVDMPCSPWPCSPASLSLVPQHKLYVHPAPARPAPNPIPSALFGSLAVFFHILVQKFSQSQLQGHMTPLLELGYIKSFLVSKVLLSYRYCLFHYKHLIINQ